MTPYKPLDNNSSQTPMDREGKPPHRIYINDINAQKALTTPGNKLYHYLFPSLKQNCLNQLFIVLRRNTLSRTHHGSLMLTVCKFNKNSGLVSLGRRKPMLWSTHVAFIPDVMASPFVGSLWWQWCSKDRDCLNSPRKTILCSCLIISFSVEYTIQQESVLDQRATQFVTFPMAHLHVSSPYFLVSCL